MEKGTKMRLINAEKLEEYKADCCVSLTEWQEGWNDAIDTIMSETSTVDAEPVRHGHWIVDEDGNIKCSECGHRGVGDNYCERCGARMDEVEDATD